MDAKELAQWPLGQVSNALYAQALQDFPDDPIVKALSPVEQSGSSGQYVAHTSAGTLRTLVGQLMSVYDGS
jgi:hypothetical protein